MEINQYNIKMGNDIARDMHCEIIMCNDAARDINCDSCVLHIVEMFTIYNLHRNGTY